MTEQDRAELETYWAFHENARRRREEIPIQLERLRSEGKGRTVQFKELLSEKLVVEMILTELRYAGLE